MMKLAFRRTLISFKREIAIILAIKAFFFLLPAIIVVVIADSGFTVASNALAAVNPVTKLVEIFNPEGEKVAEIELSTAWPVSGPVTDEFGTHEPFRKLLGLSSHTGIDISASVGTPFTTFTQGIVIQVDNVDDSSCGKNIRIKHEHGVQSIYCHLDYAIEYPIDTPVVPGDVLGYTGNTGTSTGSHLHFGISVYGIPVNPRTFMVGGP